MKSAYEIAMARLEKERGPTKKLTDEQKAQVAEIERKFAAKIAEKKLVYESEIAGAESPEDMEKIRAGFVDAIASLEAGRDKAKEAIWEA